jgi:alpha-tubulin suppressor-like RCC1 family protein
VLAWGANAAGQLGNGGNADRHLPVLVHLPAGVKAAAITAGQDYSMAITTNGDVLTWGGNSRGQLGNGTTTNTDTPVSWKLSNVLEATIIGAGPVSRTSLAYIQPKPA